MKIAHEKTKSIVSLMEEDVKDRKGVPSTVVLCFAQQYYHNGKIIRKPINSEEARILLESYSGKCVHIVIAILVTHIPSGRQCGEVVSSTIHWKHIPSDVIDKVCVRGSVYTSPGGIVIEDPDLMECIESIDGTEDSVKGMPLEVTRGLIEKVVLE